MSITVKWVYKVCPVIVAYVDGGTKGFAGISYGPFVKILNERKGDTGLLEHELTHSRQFYRSAGIIGLMYKFSKKRRYKYEMEAYTVQLSYAAVEDRFRLANKFAGFIADRYGLSVDRDKTARELIHRLVGK